MFDCRNIRYTESRTRRYGYRVKDGKRVYSHLKQPVRAMLVFPHPELAPQIHEKAPKKENEG
jgi:hypothetical protein